LTVRFRLDPLRNLQDLSGHSTSSNVLAARAKKGEDRGKRTGKEVKRWKEKGG